MPGTEIFDQMELDAVTDVIRRKMVHRYSSHAARKGVYRVSEFEKALAERVGSKHALAVSNGTSALFVALKSMGVKPGDEIITSAFTFIATVEAIVACDAVPILADIDETLGMDPKSVESKISPRTKAIMPVHMFGAAVDLDPILALGAKYGIPVVEDSCEVTGGTYKGKALGTLGLWGTYSFDPNKYITVGEGGAIVTNDDQLAKTAEYYHDHGHVHSLEIERGAELKCGLGLNFRMSEIEGALGLVALKKMDAALQLLRETKRKVVEGVASTGLKRRVIPNPEGDIATHIVFLLPTAEAAKKFQAVTREQGMGVNLLSDNTWHYAKHWAALNALSGTDIFGTPAPSYAPESMAQTESILSRAVFYCPNLITDDATVEKMVDALKAGAKAVL
jgi:8-amino-3,8-dideoxy-alpha-D-manno-octulosonate transaminase